jgi:hypothetical protein
MNDALITALERTRDGYEAEGTWMRFLIDSFHGGGGYQGRVKQPAAGWWGQAAEAYANFSLAQLFKSEVDGDSYLDRHPREDSEKYQRRINVAHYPNYVRPTTSLKISYIVRKPHKRNNVPDAVAQWIERTGYDKEFRKRALRAAVLGWSPVLVDMPAVGSDVRTAGQAGSVDPYLVPLLPCALLDYALDERGTFLWAKTVSRRVEKEWNGEAVTISRYTIWSRNSFEVYEVRESGGKKSVVGEPVKGAHKFGAVPLVSWRAEASIEEPVKADSINTDIAVEARRLFNLVSEFDEHMRSQVFALFVWPRRETADGTVELGTDNGLSIDPEQKNVPMYLAPPSSVADTYEKRLAATIVEIYRMARVEYDRASGTNSSAQSKQQNFEQTNLAIVDFAASLAQADRETLILVGRALGVAEEKLQAIECVAHDSYASAELNEEIDSVIQAQTLAIGNMAKSEMLKRLVLRLLPGLGADVRAVVESEIDAAVVQAEQDAAAMRDAEMQATASTDDESEDDTPLAGGKE